MTHKRIRYTFDGEEIISKENCEMEEVWDDGLEGFVCSKCHYSTSLK